MASIADRVAARIAEVSAAAAPSVDRAAVLHSARRATASLWTLLAASGIALGIYLRATQLPSQILLDDEWHAIHKLLHSGVKGIVTSFGVADYSIPLTLYYRFLALHGGLSEWAMHLPLLLAGIALVVIAPLLLRRETSSPVLATWIVLLAISPLLVYLSRTARPYALTCLLAFVAVIAFRNWWRGSAHAKAWACLYVIPTFLAGWLHLVTLPFTLLPFAYQAGTVLVSSREPNRLRSILRLTGLATITLVALAAALLPPFITAAGQLAEKTGADSVTPDSAYRSALMMFGIAAPSMFVACAALMLVGAYRFARRNGDFVRYVAFLALGLAASVVVARPAWVQHPLVFARYMLPALPFALLFVAEGAVAVTAPLRRPALQAVAIVIGAVLLFRAGPIPGYLYYPNQFTGHARFQFDYDDAHNPYVLESPHDPVSPFYRQLAKRAPASLTLIEAPWRLESNFVPFPWYQAVHRQYVKIGLVTPVCGVRDFGEYPATQTGLRFRNFVHLSEILHGARYGADYLVMHLQASKTPPEAAVEWPDVTACLPAIEAKLGAPVYRDDTLVAFDLKALR